MMPVFTNPVGFWALLAIPAILAIHFLQQKSRAHRTSTLFLIEVLVPESAEGRRFDWLRSSWTLWFQIAAVLAIAWVLAKPRWVRTDSVQTVGIVLDASASLEAFRSEVGQAVVREMDAVEGLARVTTWVVLSTNMRQPPVYRGTDREAALAAIDAWGPDLGEHDRTPALRLARSLAGDAGRTLFITDRRGRSIPGQRTVGVGRPLGNVGFAGADGGRPGGTGTWRAVVRNHSDQPQTRTWRVESEGQVSPVQTVELPAGGLAEISGRFPEGRREILVTLAADDFTLDDRLPLVRPEPKPLAVQVEGAGGAADFFRRVVALTDGTRTGAAAGGAPALRIAAVSAEALARETRPGIYWPEPAAEKSNQLESSPVIPERSELVADLNWQGWLSPGPSVLAMKAGDIPLLWQAGRALAFLRPLDAGGEQLILAFDWESSNASRLNEWFLLPRRFLEAQRDRQRAAYAANFDSGGPVPLAGLKADEEVAAEVRPAEGRAAPVARYRGLERLTLRAPVRPGHFTVRAGEEVLVRGAAHFADPRQGDFRSAETFAEGEPSQELSALERTTRPDPLTTFWILAAGILLFASWWPRGVRTVPPASPVAAKARAAA